jgi:hypothetical protein
MIEIIALFFLCRKNGSLAKQKGLPPRAWWLNTIAAWVVAEMVGVFLGLALFGQGNLSGLMALALVSAFGGYLLVKAILEKKPDALEDDIDEIGIDDLRPPKK